MNSVNQCLFPTALEVGPQPNGVVRADNFNVITEAFNHIIEWLQQFNSGSKQIQTHTKFLAQESQEEI